MRKRIGILFAVLVCTCLATSAQAQQDGYWRNTQPIPGTYTAAPQPPMDNLRADRAEIFGEAGYEKGDSSTLTLSNNELETLHTGTQWMGGGGFGYNIGPYINLNFDGLVGAQRQRFTFPDGSNSTLNATDGKFMFNVEYYPFKWRITPIITGGVGAIHSWTDTINTDGRVLSETDFAYDAGAGLRWDITDNLFAKVIAKATWTRYHYFNDRERYEGVFFSIGWKF
jgi:opacity protein-like surface antigen